MGIFPIFLLLFRYQFNYIYLKLNILERILEMFDLIFGTIVIICVYELMYGDREDKSMVMFLWIGYIMFIFTLGILQGANPHSYSLTDLETVDLMVDYAGTAFLITGTILMSMNYFSKRNHFDSNEEEGEQ